MAGPGEGGDPIPELPGPNVAAAEDPSEEDLGGVPDYVATLIGPGDKVYVHPQGAYIVASPDGAVVKVGKDGKPKKTSATAAKLAVGHGAWSPVGMSKAKPTPLPKDPPVNVKPMTDLEPAQAIVVEPAKEIELPSKPAPAGSKFSVPMAFDQAPISEVPKYVEDPNFVFQQKVDGIRGQLVVEPGKAPWFRARSGQEVQNTTAQKVTGGILKSLGDMPAEGPSYFVDGELLNGRWYVFDVVVDGSEKMPYNDRLAVAENWVAEMHKAGLKQVQVLPTARTPDEKRALWEAMNAQGGEGVMMKRVDAPYNPGARVTHSLKAKITATADVVVMERNIGGKENARIGVNIGGEVTEIGTVSMQGKEKGGPVNVGDVIEVEYLWAMPGTNTLQQPRMVARRPDKTPDSVTDQQLRFVQKDVLEKEGWTQATPEGAPTEKPRTEVKSVEPVTDVDGVLAELGAADGDTPAEFAAQAIAAPRDFGPNGHSFVARDPQGKLVGAIGLVDHFEPDPGMAEEGYDSPKFVTIDYVGALKTGAGAALLKQAMQYASDNDASLYLEPTEDSRPYWVDKVGAVEDPDGVGAFYHGFSVDEVRKRLAAASGPDPIPEPPKDPVSPAEEPSAPKPAASAPVDKVQAAVSGLERNGKLHASGDPRSPEGMTIVNDHYPDKPTTIHRTGDGWTATSDGKDRPLSGGYPDLYLALTEGEPKSWEGLDPDQISGGTSGGWTERTRLDAQVDMGMPRRPHPPFAYGGKQPPAKEMNPYYQAVTKWNAEISRRLKAGGPPDVGVRVADPASATDEEIEAELGRLGHLATKAHDDSAAVQDAGMNKALNAMDHYLSGMSDAEVRRISRAAEPLRVEMLRRVAEQFQAESESGFDRSEWPEGVEQVAPKVFRKHNGIPNDELGKIRDTYVVKDKNTVDKNASLRSASPSAAAKTWRGKTDKWIRSFEATSDGVTFRGIAVPPAVLRQFEPGAVITDPGVVSTDHELSNAAFYLEQRLKVRPDAVPVMLEVLVPTGQDIVDADYGEFVLPSGTPMVVRERKRDEGSGYYIITVEVGGQPAAGGAQPSGSGAPIGDGGGAGSVTASGLRTRVHGGVTITNAR